jgi:hypothetical protein
MDIIFFKIGFTGQIYPFNGLFDREYNGGIFITPQKI